MKVRLAALWLSPMLVTGGTIEFAGKPQIVRLQPFEFLHSWSVTTPPMTSGTTENRLYEIEGTGGEVRPFLAHVRIPRLPGRILWSVIDVTYEWSEINRNFYYSPVQEYCGDTPCPYSPHDLHNEMGSLVTDVVVKGPHGLHIWACSSSFCGGTNSGVVDLPSNIEDLLDSKRKLNFEGYFLVGFYDHAGGVPGFLGFNSRTTLTYKGVVRPQIKFTYYAEYEPTPTPEPASFWAGTGLAGLLILRCVRRA
jgi:hypothetical protein